MLGKGDHGHLAERACASARAANGGGVYCAPSSVSATPAPRRVGLTPFCAPPTPAPAEPPSPFLHSEPSTPPLSKRVPGRRSRNRTISPHILHAGRAAVPTSVLKAEVVGGAGGGAGRAGRGLRSGRDGAWRAPRLWAPAPPWPLSKGGRGGGMGVCALGLKGGRSCEAPSGFGTRSSRRAWS